MQKFEKIKAETKKNISYGFSNLNLLVEHMYENSAEYVKNNPKKAIKIGISSIAISFLIGYYNGSNSTVLDRLLNLTRSISTINNQNIMIIGKIEELQRKQNKIKEKIDKLEIESKSRLNTIENKIQFEEATQKGKEHVKKIKKKSGWRKILPWNWF